MIAKKPTVKDKIPSNCRQAGVREELPPGWMEEAPLPTMDVREELPHGWMEEAEEPRPIPGHWGHRPPNILPIEGRGPPARRVVRRDEGLVQALSTPSITVYNMRSMWAKIGNMAQDINMRWTDLCFLTEVWEKQTNRRHQYNIQEMMEMKGINYISSPRPGGRRGGGVAIAYSDKNFQVSKLNVDIQKPLECLFALIKQRNPLGKVKKIVAICFYSPPRSRSNTKLIDLISTQVSSFRTQYPGCGFIICGDRNDLRIEQLLSVDPALRQIVNFNTNKNQDKTLDVVVTDMYSSFQEPTRLPAIQVDPGRQGVPSDHWGVEVLPRNNSSTTKARPEKKTFMVQRMPDSLVMEFGPVLAKADWSCLLEAGGSPDEMVVMFQEAASRLVNKHFPHKQITVIDGDLPYFTEELRKLRRQRDHAYQRNGKNCTYHLHQNNFTQKLKNEAQKYKNKIYQEIKDGNRGSGYSAIRRLGESPADREQRKEFTIPAYVEAGLPPQQAADRLADHFSAISQTVAPLDLDNFSPALKEEILKGRNCLNKPTLSQHQVYMKLLRIKKPNSSVSGDIPRKLVQMYPYLWAGPATQIFNKIIQTAEWPKIWKVENAIVLHKTGDPKLVKSEDDVRTISKTHFLSKVLESLLSSWLLPIVEPYLDPGQCGGLTKSSINHYLVKMLDFIHSTLDQQTPHAAVLAALDLSKAYNRGDSMVIEDLHAMHTPGWLLALLCSYLSSRTMVLSYQQAASTERQLPGGYGAGTWLGGFLFIVKFNSVCLRPAIPRPTGNRAIQLKFVDDATKVASVNLRTSLIQDPAKRQLPLNYHERNQTIIDPQENVLQIELDRFHAEATEKNFVANKQKTFIMLFNQTRKHDFPPDFTMGGSGPLQVKTELKI